MTDPVVLCDIDARGVATVTFNRPEVNNAYNGAMLDELTAEQLVEYTKAGYGKQTPEDKQLKDVTILDVMGNAATVKLEMAGWVDYMHLAKTGDRWLIVNVLWEPKSKTK